MAFVSTVAAGDAEGDVREMYERQQAAWGFVPNYAKVFCHRPEVMARWGRLLAEIKRPMEPRRFELVTFAAAQALRHTGCALAHGKALVAFIGETGVGALAKGQDCDAISRAERSMMDFARKVATDASRITSADVEDLREHGLSDAEIFDVAATAAGRAFFTKLLDGLGVQTETNLVTMKPDLVEALTIGRPVDDREREKIETVLKNR